jgi:hypothetical protein
MLVILCISSGNLDTSSGRTILRIKAIKPSGVLELQGVDGHIIQDHSKNCAPCHLSNLDPTIITSTWIPALYYPCQVCQRIEDVLPKLVDRLKQIYIFPILANVVLPL